VASWALVASHVPTLWELWILFNGLSWAVFQAAFVGLLYLAVEPFVRKFWPDALISWLRIVGGRFRDPLATSHVLVGVTAGLALAVVAQATVWASGRFTIDSTAVVSLNGARFFLGIVPPGILTSGAWLATGLVLVMVLLRSVVRRTWVADVLFVAILTLPSLSIPTDVPLSLMLYGALVWIIRRFGLLAMVSTMCVFDVGSVPLAGAFWYAPFAATMPILLAALAAWSLYVIVTSRPGASWRPATA
jgi:hypothetical protein